MSDAPVAELTLALLGDPASFERMVAGAEARLDTFLSRVDALGAKLQASMDRSLGAVSAGAGKLDGALEPVITGFGNVASSASVASEHIRVAAGDLRDVSGEARRTGSALGELEQRAQSAGKGVSEGMARSRDGAMGATKAMSGFLATINRVRAAADKPIIQKVTVRQEGSGGRKRSSGGAGHSFDGYAMMAAGGGILTAETDMVKQGEAVEDELRKLYATAGETQNYEALRREILGIATEFGQMPVEVAKALYPIESLGYKGAAGLQVLTASARMAKGSQADLHDVAELISKTLNAYGYGADKAAHLTDVFTVAVKDAVVPGREFVPAYSSVMTIAKNAGLSVEETAGALAVMTHNAKSASVGATQLRAFISGIITPTKAMRDAAKQAGLAWLASGEGAAEFKRVGFAGVLDEIKAATNGNVTALGKLLPDMRKNQAAMALLNNGGAVFARTLKDVQDSQGATGKSAREMDKSLGQSARNMDAAFGAASSNLEDALKPVLTKVYGLATNLLNAFNRLPQSSQKTIGVIGGVTGTVLLLAGAVLTVSRWVTGMGPVFAKFAAKGVAANAAVGTSAGEAAVAEASIGPAGVASAEQLRAAATGMLTANEEVEASAAAAAAAETGVGTAAAGAAATGAAAFAVGAAWFVGITAAVALVGLLAYKWWQVEQAQNDAAKAQQKFNDAASALQAQGGQAAMIGTRAKVLSESTDLTDAITTANNDPVNITKFQKDMEVRQQLAAKGYNTSNHAYNSVDGAQARIKALDASATQLLAAINQAHNDGVNAGTKSAHSTGADGFALAVANVDPQSIITDKVGNTCANFVSKVFQKAGLQIDTINRAKDLRDKILAMGGQVHGGAALPGDLIVYHGGRFGTKAGGGYHVGYGVGDGTDWESSRGKTKRENIASNLKWGGPGATVEFITVPGSTFSHPPPDNAPPVSGGAEPAWAKNMGQKKARKPSVGGSLQDLSLKPLDDVLPLGNLNGAATDAGNYEEKLQRLDDALAAHDLKMAESGKSYDTYAVKTAALVQKLALSDNAIRNTQSKISALTPKVGGDEARLTAATSAFNQMASKMRAQKQSGQALPAEEVAEYNARRAAYAAAKATYDADNAQLKENQRVHHDAVQNKIADLAELTRVHEDQQRKDAERFLKAQGQAVKLGPDAGGITRDAYDQSLKDALGGKNKSLGALNPQGDDYARISEALTQSQIARQEAGAKLSRETLTLQKKDFDALQQDLNDEVNAYRDAGVAEGDITTWRNLKQHELDMARNKQSRDDALSMAEEMTSLGLETQAQLQQQMGQAITSLQADMATAQTPAETQGFALQIAKIRLELSKIDWEAAGKQAEGWKQAVDTGKLSVEEYILRLKDLQGQIPATAEEYQRLTSEIDEANKALYDKAEQQAGGVASKASDQIMAVLQKAKTLKQAIRESLKDATSDAIHKTIEDAIKKQVLHILVQSDADKMKKAAEKHEAATNALGGHVTRLATGVTAFGAGVDKFGQWVTQFAGLMSQPAAGNGGAFGEGDTSGGAFGQGNASGGAFGQGASSAGGAFGQGGSASSAPVPVTVTGHDNTGKSVAQADNDVSAAMSVAHASQGMGSGVNAVSNAASIATTVASASKWAQASSALSAASPYIAAAVLVASLFGPKKPPAPTVVHDQKYASVLSSFSGTIDSGYSGSDGLRTLLGPTTRQAAGVSTAGQAGQGHTLNVTIAAGAFQGVADPQGHANVILSTLHDGLARMNAVDNASRGSG